MRVVADVNPAPFRAPRPVEESPEERRLRREREAEQAAGREAQLHSWLLGEDRPLTTPADLRRFAASSPAQTISY